MNYYERHIGDYLKDTAHLSLLEHGIYTRLLDVYYTREGAIPVAQVERLVGVRSKEERIALRNVLDEFFTAEEDALQNSRCEREIARYQKKTAHNREVGKLGGRPRKSETQQVPKQEPTNNPDGFKTEPTNNPPQYPVTSNQYPVTKKKEEDSESAQAQTSPPPAFCGDANAGDISPKAVVLIARDWDLPEEWGLDAEKLGYTPAEILHQAEKFRQHWVSGKGAGTRRGLKGWRQAWSNWLSNAEKFASIRRVA